MAVLSVSTRVMANKVTTMRSQNTGYRVIWKEDLSDGVYQSCYQDFIMLSEAESYLIKINHHINPHLTKIFITLDHSPIGY